MKKLSAVTPLKEEFDGKTKVLTIRVGNLKFQTFGANQIWRWHARSRNGRLRATSGEGFSKRGNAERAMRTFIDDMRK